MGCVICFAENNSSRVSDAHIQMSRKSHFIKEKIGVIWLSFVTSNKQISGVFTKVLPKPSFE